MQEAIFTIWRKRLCGDMKLYTSGDLWNGNTYSVWSHPLHHGHEPKSCQPAFCSGRNHPNRSWSGPKDPKNHHRVKFTILPVTLHANMLVQEHDSVNLVRTTIRKRARVIRWSFWVTTNGIIPPPWKNLFSSSHSTGIFFRSTIFVVVLSNVKKCLFRHHLHAVFLNLQGHKSNVRKQVLVCLVLIVLIELLLPMKSPRPFLDWLL